MENNFSNLITPPDFIEPSARHSVLLIDPEWADVENIALFLKTSKNSFDVYLYREQEMKDTEWLTSAITRVDAVVINTDTTEISLIKDKLAVEPTSWYYGSKNFLMNKNRVEKPIDYFVQYEATLTTEKELV